MKLLFRKKGSQESDSRAHAGKGRRKPASTAARSPKLEPGRLSRSALPQVEGPADAILIAVSVALVAFGVVMVYSASAVYSHRMYGDGYHYLWRQGTYALVGIVVMFVAAGIDYHRYRLLTYPALVLTVVLLLVVALGFGRSAGGASRWIQIGPVNVQPSEIAKLSIILWLAYSLSKKAERIRDFSIGFLPHALVAGFLMLLCLKQPDFGSAVMIGLLTFVLMFTAGTRIGYLLGAVLLTAPIGIALIVTSEYRMRRIQAFLNPEADRLDSTYQIYQSLVSFGSGGITGVGIGDGRQKLLYLPEAWTDFIGAIVGEELGFLGICALVAAFATLVVRGLRAAFHAADDYGAYLAVGITMFIGLQAFTNLAVAMGLLPTKGLVLPFISYGGSSLLVNCAAMGVLLNVSRPRKVEKPEENTAPDRARSGGKRRFSLGGGQRVSGGAA